MAISDVCRECRRNGEDYYTDENDVLIRACDICLLNCYDNDDDDDD